MTDIYVDPTNLSLRHGPMTDLYVDPTYLSLKNPITTTTVIITAAPRHPATTGQWS